jgi:Glycosyltransferase family 87
VKQSMPFTGLRVGLSLAAALACVVLAVQTLNRARRPDGIDFTSYLMSAQALWEGRSPYGLDTPWPYVYPMLLAFLLIPLVALPYAAAALAWFAASLAALCGILSKTTDRSALPVTATLAASFAIIQSTLLNGQVNFLVVLCSVLAVCAARDGRDVTAGAWLGAGIALKLMPAVLAMYFLVRGRWRAVVATAVASLVFSFGPAVLLGPHGWDVCVEYVRGYVLPMLGGSPLHRDDPLVYSVAGIAHGVLGTSAPAWINAVAAVLVIGAATALDVFWWRPREQDLAAGAGYMIAVVLVSSKSELHHLAFIIPAIALGATWLGRAHEWRGGWAPSVFAAAVVGIVVSKLAGPAQGAVICAALFMLAGGLAGLTPSSASRPGSPRSSSSSPSYRAAVP